MWWILLLVCILIAWIYARWPDIKDFWYSWPFEE
jgi:hypothetical protein